MSFEFLKKNEKMKKFVGAFVTDLEAMWKMSLLLISNEYGNGF